MVLSLPSRIIHQKKNVFESKELTKENLKQEILNNGIYFPNIVLKQALWESAHLKSNMGITYNNLFGLRNCDKDYTYSNGKINGYLTFRNWEFCVKEYKIFQERKFKEKYYLDFLKTIGYAESDNYVDEIVKIKLH